MLSLLCVVDGLIIWAGEVEILCSDERGSRQEPGSRVCSFVNPVTPPIFKTEADHAFVEIQIILCNGLDLNGKPAYLHQISRIYQSWLNVPRRSYEIK